MRVIELPAMNVRHWQRHTTSQDSQHRAHHLLKEPQTLEFASVKDSFFEMHGVDFEDNLNEPRSFDARLEIELLSDQFRFLFHFSRRLVRISIDEYMVGTSDKEKSDFYEYSAYLDDYQSEFFQSMQSLRRKLVCLLSAQRISRLKEELMQKVFHPTKIEQRLARGLSIEEAFYC